jgi:hypothetical protein
MELAMDRRWIVGLGLAAGLCVPWVTAQLAAGPAAPVAMHAPGGIDYVSGGAGKEDRDAMATQRGSYTLEVVLSGVGGEYVVVDALRVLSSQGGEVLIVHDAGPIVMARLPAGSYTLETTWHGKSERRSVSVASSAVKTVNWNVAAG